MELTPEQQVEINSARDSRSDTRRPTVTELEDVLFQPIPVLDHGFVRVIDYMGDDAAVVQAARVSMVREQKRFRTMPASLIICCVTVTLRLLRCAK